MNRVLVANRGEIARRIIRACHEEGLEAIAVYSEADEASPHVWEADRAVCVGPPAVAGSYLAIDRLLDAARGTEADGVHPGYGFLAERAEFAEAVERAGLVFVGPSAAAIRAMGEKTTARQRMKAAGVPMVPGTLEPVQDVDEAQGVADQIGFPVLLKAIAGGGGKGMRRVDRREDLRAGFTQATSEATKAFGNGALYVESFIEGPRHVEIQVLADGSGKTIHLGERECSVQRRHQKMIEEAPSPALDDALRDAMGKAAVQAAESVDYVGAGTVEFLLDREGRFHFLEMNTRIQVEHPVTEMVYGVDLVREQLRIATGQSISVRGSNLRPRGHAIECRITSEDPFNDFLPATGSIQALRIPSGPGVRWDGGVETGSEVGLHYDPLLAKLIVWGEDRTAAINRMHRALRELVIVGLPTSQPFHARVLREPVFGSGRYDVRYMEEHGSQLLAVPNRGELEHVAVVAALAEDQRRSAAVAVPDGRLSRGEESRWLQAARIEGLR